MGGSIPERKTWLERLRDFGIRWAFCAIGVAVTEQLLHLLARHFAWLSFFEPWAFKLSLIYAIALGFWLALAPVKRTPNMLVGPKYYVTIDGKRQKKKVALTPPAIPSTSIRRPTPTV